MRSVETRAVRISSVPYVSETMRFGCMGRDTCRPLSSVTVRVSLCGAGVTEQAGRKIDASAASIVKRNLFHIASFWLIK